MPRAGIAVYRSWPALRRKSIKEDRACEFPYYWASQGLLFIQTAGALSFQDFVQCVGASGQGAVCRLDAGITIEGTVLNYLLETTLQRAPSFDGALLTDVDAIGTTLRSVTIRDLTFDGNRDENVAPYYSYNPDVSIFVVKKLHVERCSFSILPTSGWTARHRLLPFKLLEFFNIDVFLHTRYRVLDFGAREQFACRDLTKYLEAQLDRCRAFVR